MGRKCCVPHCKTVESKGVSFFIFPVEEKRRKEWIAKIEGLDDVPRNARVCRFHFEDCYFLSDLRNRLDKTAIPTLFPKENIPPSMGNDIYTNMDKEISYSNKASQENIPPSTGNDIYMNTNKEIPYTNEEMSYTNEEISYSNKAIQVTIPETTDRFSLTPENISTVCRVCLKPKDVVHMFENKYEELLFGEILLICSPIKLKHDETLSQYICENCLEELIQCYNFRTKCNKSEQILLNFKTELAKSQKRNERVREKLKDLTLRFHDYENILREEEVHDMTNHWSNAEINEADETKQQILKNRFCLSKGFLSDETGFNGNVDVRQIDDSNAKLLVTNNHQTTVSLKVGNAMCNRKTAVLQDAVNKSVISSISSNLRVRNPIKRRKRNPNSQMIRLAVYSFMNTWIQSIYSYPLKKRRSLRRARRNSERIANPKDRKLVIPGVCEVCNETYATTEEYKQHTKATKHLNHMLYSHLDIHGKKHFQ